MRRVTYSMSTSLDGFIVGPDGGFAWSEPDEEVFRTAQDELAGIGVILLGRRLYETMLYWETAEQDQDLSVIEREWAVSWRALPKIVFSRSLASVEGSNTRLATTDLVGEIERLRAEPVDTDIAIAGATLAASASMAGLIDEYRIRLYPILVGGGIPYFARDERTVPLDLVESRTLGGQVQYLRYRVIRAA
ncbi:dihydrofolate reductase [Nakamurella flava]|uniref:Dihydrofolate reductase n=1 Tax=Nakamurella flava TaxID=2576308 RepID=A0A4U6Q930_9ACTN|nr:dihydrofolate reductase family protein [Nakamurella flava]TKV56394.1 dihydrofolate reductase [Nakamurella flava]